MLHRWPGRIVAFVLLLALVQPLHAATADKPLPDIPFEREVLDNGLTELYVPLHTAPVVHVRVFDQVGSRVQYPDRQGFGHVF
jgi:predicted Zn-dependent peptidase